ncbi:hypothetical protein DY000_02062746 [Brassica cretica]|uniref:Uncharacterized protein n=1 Tax=Brassica cretica TaxID=69181 RepID=A0ABQ7B0M3_BRACR|nr:hypothetical protein DY000_02062746 [Brassica cretica]
MSDKPPSPTTTVETQMTTQDQLLERREQGGPLTAHGEERRPEKTSDLEDEAEAAFGLGERVLGF